MPTEQDILDAEQAALINAALSRQQQRPSGIGGFMGRVFEGYLHSDRVARDPHYELNRELRRQTIEVNRAEALNKVYERANMIKAKQGMTEINRIMAESLGKNADPDMILKRLYEVGSQYAFPPEAFDGVVKSVETMRQRRKQAEQFNNLLKGADGMNTTIRAEDPDTGAIVTLSTPTPLGAERLNALADEEDAKAAQAEAAGDFEAAQKFRETAAGYRNAVPNYQNRGLANKIIDINAKIEQLRAQADATKSNIEKRNLGAQIKGLEAQKKYYEENAEPAAGAQPAGGGELLRLFKDWQSKQK